MMQEDLGVLLDYVTNFERKEARLSRVFLSGILPYEKDFINFMDERHIQVVGDDSLILTRRIPLKWHFSDDPFVELMERYLNLPACPTRGSDLQSRLGYLVKKAKEVQAKGVLFLAIKFCEAEYFDLPYLQKGLASNGIPSLVLEREVGEGLSGGTIMRLEAFLEGIQ
jgi:benzoyl-CoA reductase/2-hydroxyglutaryl-CoA dehydratase subunit BcrC/BadD/HgdB